MVHTCSANILGLGMWGFKYKFCLTAKPCYFMHPNATYRPLFSVGH